MGAPEGLSSNKTLPDDIVLVGNPAQLSTLEGPAVETLWLVDSVPVVSLGDHLLPSRTRYSRRPKYRPDRRLSPNLDKSC